MNKNNCIRSIVIVVLTTISAFSLYSISKANPLHSNNASYPPPYPPPAGGKLPDQPNGQDPESDEASFARISQAAQNALAYVAKRNGTSIDKLRVISDYPVNYPLLGRTFQVVQIEDAVHGGNLSNLFVDLSDGHIEDNVYALEAAEKQAYQQKYGKLDRDVYNRLQGMTASDTMKVAIWITAPKGESSDDLKFAIYKQVAQKYPEAKAAMDRGSVPMDVQDPKLAQQIDSEYRALIKAAVYSRVEPIASEMRQRGYEVEILEGLPVFAATLPKSIILELNSRDDINFIYSLRGDLRDQ